MSPAVMSPSTLPPNSFQCKKLLFSACGRETELVAGFLCMVLAKAVEEASGSLVRLAREVEGDLLTLCHYSARMKTAFA